MCNFQMWSQLEEDVYLLQCTDCTTFQVRLRNTALLFGPFSFMAFRRTVNDACQEIEAGNYKSPVIVPTFNAGLDLLLDPGQLMELYSLLDSADTEIKAAQMSSLFYKHE